MTACGAFLHSLAKSQNALRNPCTTVFSAKGWAKLRQLADLRGRGSVGVIVVRFVGGPSVDIFAVELMRFGFGADAGMAGRASRPLSPGFRRSVAAPGVVHPLMVDPERRHRRVNLARQPRKDRHFRPDSDVTVHGTCSNLSYIRLRRQFRRRRH